MIDHDKNVGTVLKALDDLGIADNTFVMYSTDNGPHMNSWPDGAMTPFRSEKNSNWEGAYRVPAMFRWPGKIKPGQVSNEMVAHLDLLPTILAMAGDTQVKDKLLKGYKVGDMTYKVHLDGDNLVPYLTGQAAKSPRKSFFYINDDQQLVGLRYDNWKLVFHGAASPGNTARLGQAVHQLAGSEDLQPAHRSRTSARTSPRTPITTGFSITPSCSCPRRTTSGQFLMTFRDYPQRQKAASFNMDEVLAKLKESSGSK